MRLLGWPLRLHVAPVDRRKFLDHMHRCRRGGQVHTELTLLTGQGREVPACRSRRCPRGASSRRGHQRRTWFSAIVDSVTRLDSTKRPPQLGCRERKGLVDQLLGLAQVARR